MNIATANVIPNKHAGLERRANNTEHIKSAGKQTKKPMPPEECSQPPLGRQIFI